MNRQAESNELELWSRLRESLDRLGSQSSQDHQTQARENRLQRRARQLRDVVQTDGTEEATLQFLAFRNPNQRYGIRIDHVVEVQALEQFSPVPHTPPFIAGVIHWRGHVLSLLDLGKLLDIPETGLTDIHVCLIVEAAGYRVALVALEIEDLFVVPESEVKPMPPLPVPIPPEWIGGVHETDRIILQMDKILEDARLVEWRG